MSQQNNEPIFEENSSDSSHNNALENDDKAKFPSKEKGAKKRKIFIWAVSVIAALLLIGVAVVFILVQLGKANLLNHKEVNLDIDSAVSDVELQNDNTVVYKGATYEYNTDVTAVLCLGVDKKSFSSGSAGSNGQADAIFLAALDTKTGRSTVIPIPRDSMVEVDVYSEKEEYVGIKNTQLCLAYAYGDGGHTSCKNVAKSVSRMFYGIPIDSYIAIDMDALSVLADQVGGVKVTLTEDMDILGRMYGKGQEVTLKGALTQAFLQKRSGGLESSLGRMERQKQFVQKFTVSAIEKTKKDITAPVKIFKAITPYMVTDLSVADISFLTSCFMGGKVGTSVEYKRISGKMEQPGKYAEYIYDPQSVYEIIIDVFYKPLSLPATQSN